MKAFFVYMLCCVKYIQTQYLPTSRSPSKSPCDESNKNALVEHFFNMIFTEFHSSPPMCVCVQMCAGQATYCYPNGCLKRDDKKREVERPMSMVEHPQSSIFLVDQKNDVTRDIFTMGYDHGGAELSASKNDAKAKEAYIRPDPFKDKYKSLFKYKKMPKVELRYNLREQVKNTKSDVLKSSVDVSHTRWPQTKHSKLNGYTMSPILKEMLPASSKQKKFFISALPDKDIVIYPLRYFKRDLTRVGENKINVSANLSKDSSNLTFSLESLIDNMIENNFLTNSVANTTRIDESNKTISIETSTEYFNETDISLINATDENFDKNKYTEAINYTNIFNELIARLSKKIERRNNTSMEIVRKFSNDILIGDELSNEIDEKATNKMETKVSESTNDVTLAASTTPIPLNSSTDISNTPDNSQLTDTISDDYNEVKTMKERQTFVRKLQSEGTN